MRFLRTRNFSVQNAYESLERYLLAREYNEIWMKDLTIADKNIEAISNTGYFLFPPTRNELGQKVNIIDASKLQLGKFSMDSYFKYCFILSEAVWDEEENQVAGYIGIFNFRDFNFDIFRRIPLSSLRYMILILSNVYPIRMEKYYMVGLPNFVNCFLNFVISFMPRNWKNNVKFYDKFDEIPCVKILPKEFSGESVAVKEVMRSNYQLICQHQDLISKCNKMSIRTFGKLEID